MKNPKGFTLVEMLIVLGIVAILVAVVVSVLNPAEFFRQTRDSRRLSDLNQLDQALNLATLDNVSMGTANTVYFSLPATNSDCSDLAIPSSTGWTYQCASAANYRKVDGTGWVPVNFSSLVTVPSALSVLPVDPTNSTSTGLYYTYVNGSWELTTLFESTKYQTKYPGISTSTVYTLGNHQGISPNNIAMRAGSEGGGTTQYTLTASKTGEGTGTITSDPAGIDCGSTCNYDFDDDTEVTLTAEATEGSTFTAWSGEGCSGTGTCVVTLSEDREVTANFDVAAPPSAHYFTTSGTWQAPAGITSVQIECYGAGGGGGGRHPYGNGGSGGGGGAYSKVNSFAVTPGNNYDYVIGTKGVGDTGVNGTDGTDTTFNSITCVAKGGGGGKDGGDTYGAGGLASGGTGDVKYNGGNGGLRSSGGAIGGGGGSSAGTGSNGNAGGSPEVYSGGAAPTGGYAGGDGSGTFPPDNSSTNYGGAGGGCGAPDPFSPIKGGNGTDGYLILTY